METVKKSSQIRKLKELTERLCDRDIGIKTSLSHIEKIVFCKDTDSIEKINQIEEIIKNTEWIRHKTDGMNTQN